MTKRQISRFAADPEHKRLMLAYRNSSGGQRNRASQRLRDCMTAMLGGEGQ